MGNPTLQFDDLQNLFENQSGGQQESQFEIGYYISLVLLRRWFVIFPVFIAIFVGIYLAVALPQAI